MREQGIVRTWFEARRFGFIQRVDSAVEYFTHVNSLLGVEKLSPGQRVTFEIGKFNDRVCAVNVEVAS